MIAALWWRIDGFEKVCLIGREPFGSAYYEVRGKAKRMRWRASLNGVGRGRVVEKFDTEQEAIAFTEKAIDDHVWSQFGRGAGGVGLKRV